MIRDITRDDYDIYMELSQAFYCSSAVDHTIPKEHFEQTFLQCVDNSPYCRGIMVEHNERIVGFGLLAITYSNEAGGQCVWLEELYILPDYRSLGLGKEFFEYVTSCFPVAKRFRLEVSQDNHRAIALYESLGYTNLPYLQYIKDSI